MTEATLVSGANTMTRRVLPTDKPTVWRCTGCRVPGKTVTFWALMD